MNVFAQRPPTDDPKTNIFDPVPDDLHRSVLHQVPSWERDLTGRSALSLHANGSFDPFDDGDDSLIRVDSMETKDRHPALQQFQAVVPPGYSPEQCQSTHSKNNGGHASPMPPPSTNQLYGQHQHGHVMAEDETMDWSAGE
jgi:hypothetical protein